MSPYEIVAVVFSSIGLLISIISIVRANSAHKIAQGQIELNIHQLLNQTKKDVMDVTIVIAEKCSNDDQDMKSVLTQALNTANERNLNAYEEACAKYLDNKVDKERFKKNYHTEIRQLVEDDNNKDKFDATTSPYKAILKVYKKWNDFEN